MNIHENVIKIHAMLPRPVPCGASATDWRRGIALKRKFLMELIERNWPVKVERLVQEEDKIKWANS